MIEKTTKVINKSEKRTNPQSYDEEEIIKNEISNS